MSEPSEIIAQQEGSRTTGSPPNWQRTLYACWVAQLLSIIGFSFVMPFIPFYVRDLGVSDEVDEVVGQLEGHADLTSVEVAGPGFINLRLSPDNPSILSNMAMVRLTSGDLPGAEALLRRGHGVMRQLHLARRIGAEHLDQIACRIAQRGCRAPARRA